MTNKNKSLLRTISVVLVLILVLLQLELLPVFGGADKFWPLVLAYALLLFTLK